MFLFYAASSSLSQYYFYQKDKQANPRNIKKKNFFGIREAFDIVSLNLQTVEESLSSSFRKLIAVYTAAHTWTLF